MVLILDGNYKKEVRPSGLISVLLPILLHTSATCSELPTKISTKDSYHFKSLFVYWIPLPNVKFCIFDLMHFVNAISYKKLNVDYLFNSMQIVIYLFMLLKISLCQRRFMNSCNRSLFCRKINKHWNSYFFNLMNFAV